MPFPFHAREVRVHSEDATGTPPDECQRAKSLMADQEVQKGGRSQGVTASRLIGKIDLPQEPSKQLDQATEEPLIVTIREDGAVFLNVGLLEGDELGTRVTQARLSEQVEKVTSVRPDVPIFLGADKDITYALLAETMTTLQNSGAQSIGLLTEPPES